MLLYILLSIMLSTIDDMPVSFGISRRALLCSSVGTGSNVASAFPCESESLPTCCRLLAKHRIAMARQSKTRNPIMPPTMYRVVSSVSGAAIRSCLVEPEVHMNMSCLFYGVFYFHFIC